MVLNGKQGHIPVAGSFDSTVVEIDMGHFQTDGQGVRGPRQSRDSGR